MAEKQEAGSKTGDQWVTDLLSEARSSNPSIPEHVWARMDLQLKGQLGKRELNASRLRALSTQLMRDMVPTRPQSEDTK